jgi:MFS family permease
MPKHPWAQIVRTAAVLGAAMGIGRFAYTPILPLMTAHAQLSPQAAGQLATANYVGYLLGALAGTFSPRLARSVSACRASLLVLVASLVAMALTTNVIAWAALRTVAGFASALVFVIAVNTLLDRLHDHPAHLAGWAFGGVGVGIAASAVLVFALPASADWRAAWWAAAALAALLSVSAWFMPATTHTTSATTKTPVDQHKKRHTPFALLLTSYTLEGVGYIIAGTFLVAAVAQHSPGRLGNGTWLLVGLAVIPSAVLWARLSSRYSHPVLLSAALMLQAAGIALACTGSGSAALVGAILFGGTFIGVSVLALAAGRLLQFPGAVALLTVGYSIGQIVGPVAVSPLLHSGFQLALVAGSVIVVLAALTATAMGIVGQQPHAVAVNA